MSLCSLRKSTSKQTQSASIKNTGSQLHPPPPLPQPIYPREKAHRLGGFVGFRKSLEDLKKGDTTYPLLGIEIRFSTF